MNGFYHGGFYRSAAPGTHKAGMAKAAGFTLLELMVVLAIVAILAAIALPDLRLMVLKSRVSSSASEIISALSQARSEAVKRGGFTVLCALDAAGNIDDEDSTLTNGWVLLSGTTCKKGPVTTSTSPLLRHEPLRQLEFCITGACTSMPLAASSHAPGSIVFHQLGGVMSAEPVVMVLQPQNCGAGKKDLARRIEINQIGRVRSEMVDCS